MLTFIRYIEVFLRLRFLNVFEKLKRRISLNRGSLYRGSVPYIGRTEENRSLYRVLRYIEVR